MIKIVTIKKNPATIIFSTKFFKSVKNRKEPEPEPQFVISALAPAPAPQNWKKD